MKRGNTETETLHLNGWGVGDILEGSETWGDGTTVYHRIKITAIGEQQFLCLWDYNEGKGFERESGNTTLAHREWYKVGEDTDMKRRAGFWGRVASNLVNKVKRLEEQLRLENSL